MRSFYIVGTNVGTEMAKRLSATFVSTVKDPGKYFDGAGLGLFLRVDASGYKRWVQRVRVNGRQRDLGLGAPPVVTLAEAREKALANKRMLGAGEDPFAARSKQRNRLTFADAIKQVHATKRAEFRSEKHAKQWLSTLERYVVPKLGRLDVGDICLQDILRVLEPIWLSKTTTAQRVQQRIEAVLSWATVAGYRCGDNPARWKGNLAELLPKPSKVTTAVHQPALSLRDAPRWWKNLSARDGMGTLALQFLTLCACRSGEVREMRWSELDLSETRTWTIPAARMKANRDHRVPLTQTMVTLLSSLERHPATDVVFYSATGKALSDMTLSAAMKRIHATDLKAGRPGFVDDRTGRPAVPHGLRSTFRDWAAECGYERDMAELQLSHVVGSEVERAYRRSDMLERRRAMMDAWEQTLLGEKSDAVIPFGAAQ